MRDRDEYGELMKRILLTLLLFYSFTLRAEAEPSHPKILGISYVRIFSSDPKLAERFYVTMSAMKEEIWKERGALSVCGQCDLADLDNFRDLDEQIVLIKDPTPAPLNRIDEIVFRVSDAKK